MIPIVFGTILQINNGKTIDKNLNKCVRILWDSGASASIVHNSHVDLRGQMKNTKMIHERTAEIKLRLPELNATAEITANCHVTNQKSNYDLIIGRDILRDLGIELDFSNNATNWNKIRVPMKP